MTANDLKHNLLHGLLSGARNGLPLDRVGLSDGLQALSLTGQALRFERPVGPAQFHVEDAVADTRAIVPETVRRPLLRLLTAKQQGLAPNAFPAAIARTLAVNRLRLHPFDLPKLEAFVKAHADELGAEATAFACREAPPQQARGFFDADAIDDTTWTLATPAVKQAWLQARRRQDPAAARALVEPAFAAENADNRFRILTALREGLGSDDAEFLKSLDKDRAPRVRELAQRLLARLPGHDGDDPALRAVVERLKRGQTGLLRKRPTLALTLPATVQSHSAGTWLRETFGGLDFASLARAVDVPETELIPAAEKDANLLFAFAVMATADKRFDLLSLLADQIPDLYDQMLRAGLDDLDGYTPEERRRWADIVVQPRTWVNDMPIWPLGRLSTLLDGPVSDDLMRELMNSRPWRAIAKDAGFQVDHADLMAALCPAGQRGALRSQLSQAEPAKTAQALLFLDILDSLEASHV
ncbi:DUF5691 domain-containing protein [Asticcacaulis sp. AC402]|uniref:DUF5691 domain-containing protein n=1 Tax=Asticcacaulis sp. AC402 TaxID=1282361 RepID=UPI0012DC5EB6|nr:DUF5691 domain-containing protein [Asticcacaulis sp. AC402]